VVLLSVFQENAGITGQIWKRPIPGMGKRFFSAPRRPDRLWGPPSLLYNEYQGFFPSGVKRPGREADHSPPSSAEAKNGGAIVPLPHMSSWHGA
jgi:hypothetical protein